MKTQLLKWALLVLEGFLCPVVMAQSAIHTLPMDNNTLYDFDGDGKMEYIDFADNNGNINFYKLTTTEPVNYKTIPLGLYQPSLQHYSLQLINLNNDSYPDIALQTRSSGSFVSAAGYSNLCLLRSDASGAYSQVLETKVSYMADINQDGRMDIILPDNQLLIQDDKGNFQLISYEEVSENDESVFSKWSADRDFTYNMGSGMGAEGPQIESDAEPVIKTDWGNYGLDYNQDGKLDFIDPLTGKLMINRGNSKYVASRLGSAVYIRDLNGDCIPDYVLYDTWTMTISTLIYQPGKGYVRSILFTNKEMDEKIYFYDTDKDGDVDIIIPFGGSERTKFTYIAVFVNDGKGHFEMEENSFEKNFSFLDCKDIDNDGYFDFVAGVNNLEESSFEYYLIKGKKGNQFVAETLPFDKKEDCNKLGFYSGVSGCIADIDNDGIAEVLLSAWWEDGFYYQSKICKPAVASINQAPNKMKSPEILFNEKRGTLQIFWGEGKDKESSSADLSYAIRIGSAPGKSDIYYAHAHADGTRRNLQLGNMGYNRDITLNTFHWGQGNYYISVQAVDPLFKGSVWSDETIFEHNCFYADFTADKQTSFSSNIVTVTLDSKPNDLCTYIWDWDGAVVLGTDAADGTYKVYWIEPGMKTIKLKAQRIADGATKESQQEIKVYSNSLEQSDRTIDDISFDFNQDNVLDIFRMDGENGFMKNDGKGKFASVPGLFNTDVPNRSYDMYSQYDLPHIGDYNKDGLPDMMVLFAKFLYTNKGEYKFNKGSIAFSPTVNYYDQYHIFDMDNDGDYDIVKIDERWMGAGYTSSTAIYRNKGDNTFEKIPFSLKDEKITLQKTYLVDLDNDGYMDIVQRGGGDYGNPLKELGVLMNRGDGSFEVKRTPIPDKYKEDGRYFGSYQYFTFADMNNDGYVDMVRCWDEFAPEITIFYYDGSSFFNNVKRIPFPSDVAPQYFGSGLTTADVDNNGCKDVIVSLDTYGTGIFYMYEDGHFELKLNDVKTTYSGEFIDLNGDQIPDFIWADNRSGIKNEKPAVPQNLRAMQTEKGTVLIEWDAAKDKESPQSQLRYNLSVKKKGESGAGSFVISPMNNLSNEAAVVPSHSYISGTRYEVPLYAMPIGNYEIQLQTIDLWNEHSDMSPVYNFTVETHPLIKLPQTACTGKAVEIAYIGTSPSALSWNWDGGVITATNENRYSIVWNTPGVKNISVAVDGVVSKASLKVKELADIVTNMPSVTYLNQKQIFYISNKGGKDLDARLAFEVRKQGDKTFTDLSSYGISLTLQSDTIYAIQCSQKGSYEIKMTANDGLCLEKSIVVPMEIRSELPLAELKHITVEATGKNILGWVQETLPAYIVSRVVYKETVKSGVYERLAVIPVSQLTFMDVFSDASSQAYRYKSSYLTADGTEGECGAIHKTIHLMINQSAVKGWNLVWNQYEGMSVSTYKIYRGETVDNLLLLKEISGNMNSYTDQSVQGPCYYAIEAVAAELTRSSGEFSVRSNVLSTTSAVSAVYAENIYILGLEDLLELSDDQPSLHLYAEIYPMLATYRAVNWQIVSGNEYAEIKQNGLLTAKPSGAGNVIVRATTLDGSGVFTELTINKQQTTGVEEISLDESRHLHIYPSPAINEFTVSGIHADNSKAVISVYTVNGEMIYQEKTAESNMTINCSSFARGFYVVKAQVQDNVFIEKVMLK